MAINMTAPPPVRKTAPAREKPEPDITKNRREALTGFGQIAQAPLMMFGLLADVGAVSMHIPPIAREVAKLAETQEQVSGLIDPLIKAGPYFGLISAVLPLAVQVSVNHGWIPAGAMGSVPPVTLSSQVEAGLAQQELEALTIQFEAEAKAAEMREQIAEQRRLLKNRVASRETAVD